jgi:adenylate cyclase
VLGIFPVAPEDRPRRACLAAAAAARSARERLAALPREGEEGRPPFDFGIGLHCAEVIFGNVGTADRLSFGLVGGAVSETARLEGLTKVLGRPVIVSDAVAGWLDAPIDDLGMQNLRGVAAPRRLWALRLD